MAPCPQCRTEVPAGAAFCPACGQRVGTGPLTATGTVTRVYTNMAVVEVTSAGFIAKEIVEGASLADLQAVTGAVIAVSPTCRVLTAPAIK